MTVLEKRIFKLKETMNRAMKQKEEYQLEFLLSISQVTNEAESNSRRNIYKGEMRFFNESLKYCKEELEKLEERYHRITSK